MNFIEEAIAEKWGSLWSRFRSEIILISLSVAIFLISLAIFVNSAKSAQKISFAKENKKISFDKKTQTKANIFVDLSGAVENPDVYEIAPGARLKDLLKLANGLAADADREYVARNLNLAKILVDQEKVYIPSVSQSKEPGGQVAGAQTDIPTLISINSASLDELDKLPGVGPVMANKIISGRPYGLVDELLRKKIIGKSLFEKIKALITN